MTAALRHRRPAGASADVAAAERPARPGAPAPHAPAGTAGAGGADSGHDETRAPWLQVLAAAAACAGLSVACFSNAFDAEFVFDDNGAIVENPDVMGPGELWDKLRDMAAHDYWGSDMRVSSHKSYRPLTVLRWCSGARGAARGARGPCKRRCESRAARVTSARVAAFV